MHQDIWTPNGVRCLMFAKCHSIIGNHMCVRFVLLGMNAEYYCGSLSFGPHGGCCTSGPSNKVCSRHANRLRWKRRLCRKDVNTELEHQLSPCFLEMWWTRYSLEESWTPPNRCPVCYCCFMACHAFLDQATLCGIWVGLCHFVANGAHQNSWAIFHIVGANPKMKSKMASYLVSTSY